LSTGEKAQDVAELEMCIYEMLCFCLTTYIYECISTTREVKKMKDENYLDQLKEFKKSSGWSYQQLSYSLRLHSQTVIGWFSGRCNPSPMATERIKKFLKSVERSNSSSK